MVYGGTSQDILERALEEAENIIFRGLQDPYKSALSKIKNTPKYKKWLNWYDAGARLIAERYVRDAEHVIDKACKDIWDTHKAMVADFGRLDASKELSDIVQDARKAFVRFGGRRTLNNHSIKPLEPVELFVEYHDGMFNYVQALFFAMRAFHTLASGDSDESDRYFQLEIKARTCIRFLNGAVKTHLADVYKVRVEPDQLPEAFSHR